jgi:hypothetical protein
LHLIERHNGNAGDGGGVGQICVICQNVVFLPKKAENEKLIPAKMNHISK